jgi:hypothetical protein
MDFYPENIILEIISLLNAPSPPGDSPGGWEKADISLKDLGFVWWLEYYLRTEPDVFEETFDSLPRAEQSALFVRTWRCFLHRPLMQRLFPSGFRPENPYPWKLLRDGSLLQLIGQGEKETVRGLYYVFPHGRLWPGLVTVLRGKVFLTPEDLTRVHTAIAFTRQSRLDLIRGRTEELPSFPDHSEPGSPPARLSPPEEAESEITAVKPLKPRKKKKTTGQLSLFD